MHLSRRTRCSSWYANLFYGGNRQHLLVTHEATLFSVVFPGRGLTSADLFAERFHLMMYSYLEALRLGAAFKLLIAPYTKGITLAKTTEQVGSLLDERFDLQMQTEPVRV